MRMRAYPEPANIVVVKEFYGYAMSYTSYVRGKIIPYDAATINSFLGINEGNNPYDYVCFINTNCDYEEIERVVYLPRDIFVRNK